jgi:hypothetical protein
MLSYYALGILAVITVYYLLKNKRILALVLVLGVPIALGWLAVHIFTNSFASLSGDTLVATVQGSRDANVPHLMHVQIEYPDGAVGSYMLDGDRWELNGDVVAYQPWVNMLGLQNGFTLTRLTSQYDDSSAHSIQPVDLSVSPQPSFLAPYIVKSHYENGVIEPADGVVYKVYVNQQKQMYAVHA